MFRKNCVVTFILIGMIMVSSSCANQKLSEVKSHPAINFYDGWKLGVQAWSFNRYTFYEAIDKTAALGLSWIEAFPGQNVSKDMPDVKFGPEMLPEIRKQIKAKLASSGVRLVNYGVARLPADEAKCRKVFEFAKDMGIETIVSEPEKKALDIIEKLCDEYGINLAIHNHPKPTRYWDPHRVLAACKGRSKRIGACADTGHWMRSGVNVVDALKLLEGRIISLHFKDLNEFGNKKAHGVPWGTGIGNVKATLVELHRQDFKGVFSIEYEYHWTSSMPELAKCVEYFSAEAAKLNSTGWQNLFNGRNLKKWIGSPQSWSIEADGSLFAKGGGKKWNQEIWTKENFGNFILDLEFKLAEESNSGIFIRTADLKDFVQTGIEVQMLDPASKITKLKAYCGAIYDCLAPNKDVVKPAGQWNHCTITCDDNKIYVVLNGEQIIDMDLNRWDTPGENPDGTPNKFKKALKDMPRVGHIGLQAYNEPVEPVWYRNIRIKSLD